MANTLLLRAQRAALLFVQPSAVAGKSTWTRGVWASWPGWCWGRDMAISRLGDISASRFFLTLQSPPWSEDLCVQVLLHLHLQKRSGGLGIMERKAKVRERGFHSQWAVVQEVWWYHEAWWWCKTFPDVSAVEDTAAHCALSKAFHAGQRRRILLGKCNTGKNQTCRRSHQGMPGCRDRTQKQGLGLLSDWLVGE